MVNPNDLLCLPQHHISGVVVGADDRRPRLGVRAYGKHGRICHQVLQASFRFQIEHRYDACAAVGDDCDSFVVAERDGAAVGVGHVVMAAHGIRGGVATTGERRQHPETEQEPAEAAHEGAGIIQK